MITDVREGVGWLTLNNPDERNTLTAPMVDEIVAAMDSFEADESVGAVVVTGAGTAFCAGADLGNLQAATRESLANIYEGFLRDRPQSAARRWRRSTARRSGRA